MKKDNIGTEIVLNTDFEALLNKLYELISAMITSENITLEHKIIVEGALGLIVASIINEPSHLQSLMDFKS